ncbi:11817_t:CDS:2 [Diversispora eburnea]|uniref:11817_t:CDS:1 n=1 Tax=Diversispora eburnea TaxID=1213867 RepID=A0A9N9CYI9_9GLOM|nr:11817_t:CDS:2 [Diversispora eburnea]
MLHWRLCNYFQNIKHIVNGDHGSVNSALLKKWNKRELVFNQTELGISFGGIVYEIVTAQRPFVDQAHDTSW